MGEVIQFPTQGRREPQHKPRPRPQQRTDDFGENLARIKVSLVKCNRVMEALKEMARKNAEDDQ